MFFDALGHIAVGQVPQNTTPVLAATTGGFLVTGNSAGMIITMGAQTGPFALAGGAALFTGRMPSAVGSFAETGNAAAFITRAAADTVQYNLTGFAATFTGTGSSPQSGPFIVTGNVSPLTINLNAAPGSFSASAFDAHYYRDFKNWVTITETQPETWQANGIPSSSWTNSLPPSSVWTIDPIMSIPPPESA